MPFESTCSIHLSGIVNGLTHVSALAGEASAVADAPTSAVGTPKIPPRNVGIALPRAMVRYTDTATRVGLPDGSLGNVTSEVRTDGGCSAMRFACAVLTALATAGPVDERSVKLLNTSAVAPAS